MEDPILLDATMVRCVANRDSVSYDPECVNAREAVERLAAAEKEARRAALEAESERKREALRRAREAADEARRRAEALANERAQAEYLGLVPATAPAAGEAGPAPGGGVAVVTAGDVPDASAEAQGKATMAAPGQPSDGPAPGQPSDGTVAPPPAAAAGDATPDGEPAPETAPVTTDLGEIRKALEERAPAVPAPADPAGPSG